MSRKSKKEMLSGLIVPLLLYFSQYGMARLRTSTCFKPRWFIIYLRRAATLSVLFIKNLISANTFYLIAGVWLWTLYHNIIISLVQKKFKKNKTIKEIKGNSSKYSNLVLSICNRRLCKYVFRNSSAFHLLQS